MNILLIGSENSVSRSILDNLILSGHSVFKTHRNNIDSEYFFDIENETSWKSYRNVDLIIYSAWKMKPRNRKISEKNILAAKAILTLNKDKSIIFISSMSANPRSRSEYGSAKYEAEKEFLKYGKFVIKPGILYDSESNSVLGTVSRIIGYLDKLFFLISVNPDFTVYISNIEVVSKRIFDIIEGNTHDRKIEEEISFNSFMYMFTSAKYFRIPIRKLLIDVLFKSLHLSSENLNDANDSWISISRDSTNSVKI
jgi:hypothetical protein